MIFKNQNSPRNGTFHIYIYIYFRIWNMYYNLSLKFELPKFDCTYQVHCSEQVEDSTKWILLNELFLS